MTNTVTFQRATVYCVCQEAGRIRGEITPPIPPPPPPPNSRPLKQMKASRCLGRADVGMIPLIFLPLVEAPNPLAPAAV